MMEGKFLNNKKILVISPESYDHIPVSKHHFSRVLAQLGNKVFFLNPPSENNRVVADEQYPNLFIVDYRAVPGTNRFPGIIRNMVNRYLIQKIERLCSTRFDMVWSFDPFRFQNLQLFRHALARIYHVVDIHHTPREMELASTADIVLGVSDEILKRFSILNKPTVKINHGLTTHFMTMDVPVKSAEQRPVKVGYVGNLNMRSLDQETLLKIVRNHPEVNFYMIGPYLEDSPIVRELRKNQNCFLIGKITSEKLPSYLVQYDMFLMCYKGHEVAINSNSHKLLEYLATGRPVVINYTDEYKNNELVVMAQDNEALPLLFSKVVNHLDQYATPELSARRVAFARGNSYLQHVLTIDKILISFRHASSAPDTQQA